MEEQQPQNSLYKSEREEGDNQKKDVVSRGTLKEKLEEVSKELFHHLVLWGRRKRNIPGKQLKTAVKEGFQFKVGQLIRFGGNNKGIDNLHVLEVIIGGEEKVLLMGEECKRELSQPLKNVEKKRNGFIETSKNILVNGVCKSIQ